VSGKMPVGNNNTSVWSYGGEAIGIQGLQIGY